MNRNKMYILDFLKDSVQKWLLRNNYEKNVNINVQWTQNNSRRVDMLKSSNAIFNMISYI